MFPHVTARLLSCQSHDSVHLIMVIDAIWCRHSIDGTQYLLPQLSRVRCSSGRVRGPGGQVVVDTVSLLSEAVKLDEMCRGAGVAYVRGEIRGVFGSVFCDFGDAFTVLDPDGEPPVCQTDGLQQQLLPSTTFVHVVTIDICNSCHTAPLYLRFVLSRHYTVVVFEARCI